jgi:hypothetical protein
MNEMITPSPDPMPQPATSPAAPVVEPLSVTDKFVGIFTEPSATYQNIRDAGTRNSDWLVPLFVFIVILIAGTLIRFSNPEFMERIKQQQIDAMQQRVESGSMTQEQADQAIDQMDKFAGLQKILAPVGAAVGVFVVFFLIVLIYWLLTKFAFKANVTYALMLAVVGLSMYIGVIDQLVSVLLMYVTGNPLATFSPTIFMASDAESVKHASYRLLTNFNPISLWSYAVVSIGVHKVTGLSKGKAYGVVFGLWIVWVLVSSFALSAIPGMG